MRFGLQLMNLDWQQLKDTAQAAESLGFSSVLLPDHLLHEGPEREYQPETIMYDAMVRAAVLLEATRTIRVGHLVLCNLFRHPMLTAQGLTSLDTLSGGRIVAGIGSGWLEREFQMSGIAFPDIKTRLRMLDEALTCIRSLWTRETTTFEGEFYNLREAILCPKPVQRPHPPIVLGGAGKGLLRIAARHADVVNIVADTGKAGYISLVNVSKLTDASFRAKIEFLRAEASRQGRDPRAIEVSNAIFSVSFTDSPAATRTTAEGMGSLFGMSAEEVLKSPLALIGTPEECVAELKRREREWDLSEAIFSWADPATMRRIGEEVIPHV